MFGLGPEFMVIRPEGHSLESVVEEARKVRGDIFGMVHYQILTKVAVLD